MHVIAAVKFREILFMNFRDGFLSALALRFIQCVLVSKCTAMAEDTKTKVICIISRFDLVILASASSRFGGLRAILSFFSADSNKN